MENSIEQENWQAIINNDKAYDDKFIYAVKTTGIFCRPSCKSKPPNKENVRIFQNAEQALSAQFRPCKRCKPTGERLPDHEWVAQITQYIDTNYSETLTLETLAAMCHGSPYHLQRTFKRIKGMTPVEYVQQTRMTKAMEYLIDSDKAISDIAIAVGMANIPYFITLFKKITGHTPTDYRQLNSNIQTKEVLPVASNNNPTIYWTLLEHEDWKMYMAATSKGLCYVGSQNKPFEQLTEWAGRYFSGSVLVQDDEKLQPYSTELREYFYGKRKSFTVPFDFRGTAFQLAVWNALCEIPYGQTQSYSDIANYIEKPAAVRAVGAAIGANPVLISVPCHRVIGKNGSLTGYRGGLDMKTKLLQLENESILVEGSPLHA